MKTLKITLLLALISIMMIGCNTTLVKSMWYGEQTEYQRNDLKGDVKILEQSQFKAIDSSGVITKGDRVNKSFIFRDNIKVTFNENKDVLEKEAYDSNRKLRTKDTYKYDGNNNLLEWIELVKSEKPDRGYKHTYKFKYDDTNKKIKQEEYHTDSTTTLFKYSIYKYDDQDNLIKDITYLSDTVGGMRIYKYDEQSRMIENVYYDDDCSFIYQKFTYKYYDNMNDCTTFTPQGELRTVTYTYDNNNNILEMDYNNVDEDTPGQTVKFKYDKYDNLIESIEYNEAGEITETETLTYKYDKHNNWVERIEYRNKIPTYITIREITYY